MQRLDLRFAHDQEREFERKTGRARGHSFNRIAGIQLVMTHIGAVGLYVLLGNALAVIIGTVAIDLFGLCGLVLMQLRPHPVGREVLMMLGVLSWVLMAEILSFLGTPQQTWIIQTAIALQPFVLAVAIQLRFPYCLFGSLTIVVMIGVGNALFSQQMLGEQLWMLLLQIVAASYALYGGWKLEQRERLNYQAHRQRDHDQRQLDAVNERLETLTYFDELTGILNRRGLRRRLLEHYVGKSIGVILIDVDYFKRFNDLYGHIAGDDCLKEIATTLAATLSRDNDCIARWGGEEFLVLVEAASPDECASMANRLHNRVEQRALRHDESPIAGNVTISSGYSFARAVGEDRLEELISHADRALYAAKRAGRNRTLPCAAVSS